MTDELAYLSATEIAARIRRREVSPVEVMDATIARIEKRNPSLNALVFTDFEGAVRISRYARPAIDSRRAKWRADSVSR